ncbi:MAG: hypothetical protein AAGG68_28305 [Bacteroidota bacterium]
MKISNIKSTNWSKFFIGFAVVTVLSGIYLVTQKDYVSGIAGSMTGFLLIYLQKFNRTVEL